MKTEPQTCPLCGAASEFYPVDHGNRKYFNCPRCTKFQISLRAEDRLAEAPKQWRDSLAGKARLTPPEHLLVIVVPSPPASDAISGDYVPKAELPL